MTRCVGEVYTDGHLMIRTFLASPDSENRLASMSQDAGRSAAEQSLAKNFDLCGSRDEEITCNRPSVLNYAFGRIAKYDMTRHLDRERAFASAQQSLGFCLRVLDSALDAPGSHRACLDHVAHGQHRVPLGGQLDRAVKGPIARRGEIGCQHDVLRLAFSPGPSHLEFSFPNFRSRNVEKSDNALTLIEHRDRDPWIVAKPAHQTVAGFSRSPARAADVSGR